MSPLEQETAASVTQLQELRTAAETYETFYQLYGSSELKNHGFSTILSRVLHMDETEDRSTHFVVAHADVPRPPIKQHFDRFGVPSHLVSYAAKNFIAASTDGVTITNYDVIDAYGLYRAHIDDDDHKYNPYYETTELSLMPRSLKLSIKHLIRAEFNMGTGDGTVAIGELACGWILSAEESSRIRKVILTPELTDTLGQTA